MKKGNISEASPRPWRVEYVTRMRNALVKAADNAVVCVCNADNAEMIVAAANRFDCPTAGHAQDAKPQRIECLTDLQAARADSAGE